MIPIAHLLHKLFIFKSVLYRSLVSERDHFIFSGVFRVHPRHAERSCIPEVAIYTFRKSFSTCPIIYEKVTAERRGLKVSFTFKSTQVANLVY